MHEWLLADDAASTVVSGRVNAGVLTGGNTEDVQAAVNGTPAFHLDGSTQYVTIPLISSMMRADEYASLWTKYASNPVLGDGVTSIQFGGLTKNPAGGWYFYGATENDICRWSSVDLITWTDKVEVLSAAAPGAWDSELQVCHVFRQPDTTWRMLYRGNGSGGLQIGMATSADGTTFTRVGSGLFAEFDGNFDPTCVMLIDGVYHIYVNGDPDHGHTNLYTTTDWVTVTPYAGNPIFDNGFCGTVWKTGSYYYMLIPRDLGASNSVLYEHGLALYRCTDQYFDYGTREYLGYPVVNDQTYDDRYLDTPSIPVTDVYRNTYAPEFGDNLHIIYSGDLTGIKQCLVSSTFTALAARTVIPESWSEDYHHEGRTFSFWVQFDALVDNDVVFSIGSSATDSAPVQLAHLVSSTIRFLLGGGFRQGTGALSANVPYHIVVVDDIGTTRVYVNGVLTGTLAYENPSTDAINLYIGKGEGGDLDGYVWNWKIYNVAASTEQAVRLYRTGSID